MVKVAAVEAEAEEEGDGNKKSFTSNIYIIIVVIIRSYLLALFYSINLCDASSALRIILHLPAYSYIINII